ncbi:MAG: phosphotransferase [Eubacteriaceae bacterium]|nr:phosphotransferase [Eubacteriaceae bacterium]
MCEFAKDLANFLKELESIDSADGLPAGAQNFHRGGDLAVYDTQTSDAIKDVSGGYGQNLLLEIWELALSTKHTGSCVWVHGDVAVANLLAKNGKVCGVIDFGGMGTGDPSCDYVMAWTFFDKKSRKVFLMSWELASTPLIAPGDGVLWKALITYGGTANHLD